MIRPSLPSNIRTRSADWNRSIAKPLQHVGCDGVDSRGVGSLQAMLVTLAGHDILIGRALLRPTTAGDYANFILACLTHDIGHVRGIVQGDEDDSYVVDVTGRTMRLPRGLYAVVSGDTLMPSFSQIGSADMTNGIENGRPFSLSIQKA
jgi:hypothetical protein